MTAVPRFTPAAKRSPRSTPPESATSVIDARNRPLGLFTKGRRPELKALSGQEQLPVLELPNGETINGSKAIITWARSRPRRPRT